MEFKAFTQGLSSKGSLLIAKGKPAMAKGAEYAKQHKKACIVGGSAVLLGLVAITSLGYVVSGDNHAVNKHSMAEALPKKQVIKHLAQSMQQNVQSSKIDTVQKEIERLNQTLASSGDKEDITSLKQQLNGIQHSLEKVVIASKAASLSAAKTRQAQSTSQKNAQKNLKALKAQLARIQKAVVKPKFLPASALPFHVEGIDYWNNQPMVTIAMGDIKGGYHYKLMAPGMRFSCNTGVTDCSWRLEQIKTQPNMAIFQNAKNQQVKVEI